MAGIRRRRNKRNGKQYSHYDGWYRDWQGHQRFFKGTTNQKETMAIARRHEDEHNLIRLGVLPVPRPERSIFSIEEIKKEYLAWGEAQGGRGGRPWSKTHLRMRRSHLAFWIPQLNLASVADLMDALPKVEKALRELGATGLAPKTLNNYGECIASFCDWCVNRGYLDRDPLKSLVQYYADPKSIRRAIHPDELKLLLQACSPERRLLVEVAVCSGLRADELRHLRVGDLDVEQSGLILSEAWTKNRKPGFQPLPAWLVSELARFAGAKQAGEPLLTVPKDTARALDKNLKKAGIPKHTPEGKLDFHALRTSYVSLAVEQGATVKEAQTLARHSTPGLTLNVYARTRDARLAEVIEAVGDEVRQDRFYDTGMTRAEDAVRGGQRNALKLQGVRREEEWRRGRDLNPRYPL